MFLYVFVIEVLISVQETLLTITFITFECYLKYVNFLLY